MTTIATRNAARLVAALLVMAPLTAAAAPPAAGSITALGEVCYVMSGQQWCFLLELTFDPAGGPLAGTTQGTAEIPVPAAGVSFVSSVQGAFRGTFAGGDGGSVSGTWQSTSQVSVPAGFTFPGGSGLVNGTASGTWEGVLRANGTGKGTLSGTGASGNPANGTWVIYYYPADFLAGLAAPTDTPAPPTAPPVTTSLPTPTLSLPPGALPDSLAALAAAIARERAALLSPDRSALPPVLAPWYFGQVVRMAVDEEGEVVARDIFGHSAPIHDAGAELTSLSDEVIQANPGFDWAATLTAFGQRALDAVSGMGSTAFTFVSGTLDDMLPSQTALDFLDLLTTPPDPGDAPITQEQASTLQGETLLHTLQSQQENDQADPAEGVEPNEPEEQLTALNEQQREADRYHYVELLNAISQEEWDRLIEDGLDPAEVVRSRRSMNRALQAIRARLGEEQLSQIELQFKLNAESTKSMRGRLLSLGATPDQANQMARATAALRVLTALGEEHTVSTGGLLDGLTRFVDAWILRSHAQAMAINAAGTNLQGLSETQLALIQSADRQGLIDALTAESELKDDPILRLILDEIKGGR